MSNTTFKRCGAPMATALLTALVLAACGGGGGNPGAVGGSGSTGSGGTGTGTGGTIVAAAPTVTVGFLNASGASTNALTSGTPLTVKATVLDKDKKPVPNAIVSFATDNTLAVFSPSTGTALTDVNGVATVSMRVASLATGGAAKLTATSTVAGTTMTGESNYSVGATTLNFGTLNAKESSIQAYDSTELSVPVLSGNAAYTDQQVSVHFSSACVTAGKATMATTVQTISGIAKTVYRDKGCGNNDVITVSSDGIAKPASTMLTIAPPGAASVQFTTATPISQSIVIQGNGGIGRTETAILNFKVVDIFGNPLAGQKVEFKRVPDNADVTVNKSSDITDATGSVVTTVNSGSTATSFRVRATLPNTAARGNPDISTVSDSIVVTTGLPVQNLFSIATDKFNIEGLNVQSSPSAPAANISVSLGDAFTNPVPDGTPIVFRTSLGIIGTSDKGGCNTTNGTCSVQLRAQNASTSTSSNPPTQCSAVTPDSNRPGVATICASTSDGTNFIYAKTTVFFSGGQAVNTFMNGTRVSFDALAPNDLGTISASATKVFQLQFNDVNFNPMPAGSSVAITSMLNGNAAAVVPATVPNIAPHSTLNVDDPSGVTVSGNQGSTHTFSISSSNPTSCTTTVQASFNVTVTTLAPFNSVTNIPFKLTFTCP
ncbi:hypothetical protein ACI48D_10660 [Massilia sp. LXY-6]|uniref:hypothetical protein n=1 Tax=Massilia sp. LXY-6 TaxID=3379823 RepID=UPI003EE0CDA0